MALPAAQRALLRGSHRARLSTWFAPGSVPWHNASVFVCAKEPLSDGGRLQQLAGVLDRRESADSIVDASKWTFSTALCECPPTAAPGDMLVFPHYLHLRPGRADFEEMLQAVAGLQPVPDQPGEWQHSDTSAQRLEVVGSLRESAHIFVWGGGGPSFKQSLLDLSSEAAVASQVLLSCPPVIGSSQPDILTGQDVSAAVFTPQSREYSTWGPGCGEWFGGHSGDNKLALQIMNWLHTAARLGWGPQGMNVLGTAMAGAWRGRLGLDPEAARAIAAHFSG